MPIKDSAETWIRGKPAQAAVIIAAVGLVLGGVIGLGAGYTIEKNRTKADVDRLKAALKAGGKPVTVSGTLGQSVGKVTAVGTDTITVDTKRKGSQEFRTTAETRFEQAVKGATSDITVGSRVLVTINGREVIILSDTSKIGRKVLTVGSDSFSIAKPNGGPGAKLMLENVKSVSKLSPANFSDIKTGSSVLAGGREANKDAFNAVEVILLESGSGFAA